MSTAEIVESLRDQIGTDAEVSVSEDPFGGFRIRVVSVSFDALSKAERRSMLLDVVDDDDIAAYFLLTPEEVGGPEDSIREGDEALETLPLWADTLAESSGSDEITVRLASKLQAQLPPPVVATFYSLRGGVGRSTALAHTAFNLTSQGLSVLCIDMDLEAPGLSSLFRVEEAARESRGVVDLLSTIDIDGIVPADLSESFVPVPTNNANSRLLLLPAGEISAAYARDLSLITPENWYREHANPLRLLIGGIRELDEKLRPDVILIDSRTGLSPIAAPLLFDVADLAIITFLPHPQAKVGTGLLTRALLTARTDRESNRQAFTPEPRFVISPVAPSEDNFARAQQRAIDWIGDWLAPARDEDGAKPFDDIEEIVHVVGYNEEVAASDSASASGLHNAYAPIGEWIAGLLESSQPGIPVEDPEHGVPTKLQVLESLRLTGRTADGQSVEDLREIFVGTEAVSRALKPETRLVLGRKGTGKTLLFRQIHNNDQIKSIAVTRPAGKDSGPLDLDAAQYLKFDAALDGAGLGWDAGWRAILVLSALRDGAISRLSDMPELKVFEQAYRGSDLLKDFRTLLSMPDADVLLSDWLVQVDEGVDESTYALFDGLDTGFGPDRKLRDRAVTGLLLLLNGQARSFNSLRFKVFLREDIFRAVDIPNRSHLRAEASVLAWNDQFDYLRLIIRQVWRSREFQAYAKASLDRDRSSLSPRFTYETSIEYWPDEIVLDVWRVLVGERMSGGKTAFTQNWVWSRLADANEDHAPRHLVGLFERAIENERKLEPGAPYIRALIRPRALSDALDPVSDEALDALEEEFPELEDVLQQLREIPRTPFDAELAGETELAAEVGLLSRGDDGRYRVPDIYRRPLKMGRQGQQ